MYLLCFFFIVFFYYICDIEIFRLLSLFMFVFLKKIIYIKIQFEPGKFEKFDTEWLYIYTFTFMHLADAFIQSNLQCIQVIIFLSVCVFPGNWTHNLLRC